MSVYNYTHTEEIGIGIRRRKNSCTDFIKEGVGRAPGKYQTRNSKLANTGNSGWEFVHVCVCLFVNSLMVLLTHLTFSTHLHKGSITSLALMDARLIPPVDISCLRPSLSDTHFQVSMHGWLKLLMERGGSLFWKVEPSWWKPVWPHTSRPEGRSQQSWRKHFENTVTCGCHWLMDDTWMIAIVLCVCARAHAYFKRYCNIFYL